MAKQQVGGVRWNLVRFVTEIRLYMGDGYLAQLVSRVQITDGRPALQKVGPPHFEYEKWGGKSPLTKLGGNSSHTGLLRNGGLVDLEKCISELLACA